jgi:hypothetical protein
MTSPPHAFVLAQCSKGTLFDMERSKAAGRTEAVSGSVGKEFKRIQRHFIFAPKVGVATI